MANIEKLIPQVPARAQRAYVVAHTVTISAHTFIDYVGLSGNRVRLNP
ncbi:MAG: hypothetical protein V2G42_05950 [bacterium JZ-2024 1]